AARRLQGRGARAAAAPGARAGLRPGRRPARTGAAGRLGAPGAGRAVRAAGGALAAPVARRGHRAGAAAGRPGRGPAPQAAAARLPAVGCATTRRSRMPHLNRREMLGALVLPAVAACTGLDPQRARIALAAAPPPHVPPGQVAQDEDFWDEVS